MEVKPWFVLYFAAFLCVLGCVYVVYSVTVTGDTSGEWVIWVLFGLTLALVGALIFILKRRSAPEEETDETMKIPSSPVSRRRPGAPDLDLEPSPMIRPRGVNGGALGEEYSEDIDQEEIPWVQQFDREMDDIMMEALDDEDLRMDADQIYTAITTLKRKQKDGELAEEDYRRLKQALNRIKEE